MFFVATRATGSPTNTPGLSPSATTAVRAPPRSGSTWACSVPNGSGWRRKGSSRAVEGEDPRQFHGVQHDIEAFSEFIRLYITRFDRWTSPKYLLGESYGTVRSAGVAQELQSGHGFEPTYRERVSMVYFEAGHMMYIRPSMLEKFKQDVGRFIRDTKDAGLKPTE